MTNRTQHLISVTLLALAALALISLALTPTAYAATGCTMYVSSTADNTTGDTSLTLREAVLLANDGTTASGLNRGFTVGELAHLGAGCVWDANRLLTVGGAGFVDTIYFSTTVGSGPIITLTKALTLTDPGGDVLNGTYNAMTPTLDFDPVLSGPGLVLLQNQVVKGVRVMNAAAAGIDVQGSNNQLLDVAVWRSHYGIYIRGDSNTVDGAFIGVKDATVTTCTGWGNATSGLVLFNGGGPLSVQNNVIKNSRIVCNGYATPAPAIYLAGAGVYHNTLGPNNLIGTTAAGGGLDLGNTGDGLLILSRADFTDILSNTFAYNTGNGATITKTYFTRLGGNWIRYNDLDGVLVGGDSQNTVIGGPSLNNSLTGNVIGKNGDDGVELQGSNVRYTLLAGNAIGVLPGTGQYDGNYRHGVRVDGAHNNAIGDTNALTNTIGGSFGMGVLLTNGASQNAVARNVIGLATAPNNIDGVYLANGAHDNVIGAMGNVIEYNSNGVTIEGSTTATNTVINNNLRHNITGIRLSEGTFNNAIGQVGADNTIAENTTNGLEIASGAHHNFINGNIVSNNSDNGLRLLNTATNNVITGTTFISNGRDGLSEDIGTSGNNWSHLYFQANGGLPIDKQTNSDTTNIVNAPPAQIRSRVAANSVVTITGVATAASLFKSVQVEVYAYSLAGGHIETVYLGNTSANNAGAWTLTLNNFAALYRCLMAFETATTNVVGQVKTSSEFGFPNCRNLLPAVVR